MARNGHVTPREFDNAILRIDGRINDIDTKLDKLSSEFTTLRAHFNDELADTIRVTSLKAKWKFWGVTFGFGIVSSILLKVFLG